MTRTFVLLLMLAGCGAVDSRDRPRGPEAQRIVLRGREIGGERSAWVHVPDRKGSGKLPVVLAFHGGTGNSGRDMAPKWQHLFDEPILFVFPNGQLEDRREAGWTGVGRGTGDELVDVRFVEHLLEELGRRYPIDEDRIYAAGHSNGGQMTWNLACQLPDRFAGFAIVSKSAPKALTEVCDAPANKPLIYFNGTADRDTWLEGPYNLSAEDTIAWWLGKQGCERKPAEIVTRPDRGDRTTVFERQYACPRGTAAEFFVIEGGGHPWPTPRGDAKGTCHDIDASTEILRFWKEHAGL